MRIEFERSGGFMGLRQSFTLDTASLDPQEAEEITKLVDHANFFSQPNIIQSDSEGADHYQYRLKIDRLENSHTVIVNETATPDELQPLLQHLNTLARTHR